MRLGFINLSMKLTHYFAELGPYLKPFDIQPVYFTLNPKVRSMMARMGVPYAPQWVVKGEDILSEAVIAEIMDPVLEHRYHNKQRLHRYLARLHHALREFYERERIDAVFIWNGSDPEGRVAMTLARHRGMKMVFGENGYLPDTMQLDPEGINYAASVTRRLGGAVEAVNIDPVKQGELQRRVQQLQQRQPWSVTKPMVKASLRARLVSELHNFSWNKVRRGLGGNKMIPETVPLPQRFIFIPFQVEADSQLVLYSPLVGCDMERFLSVCHQALQRVAPDCRLVVKLHPANLGQINYDPLLKKYPDVLFQKGGSIVPLIESCEAVITINSTVGFEALTYHKPVITLGKTFYNVPGVVHHATSLDELPQTIKTALSQTVDRERIDNMLYYLFDSYLGHGSWKNHTPASYQAVSGKIAEVLREA